MGTVDMEQVEATDGAVARAVARHRGARVACDELQPPGELLAQVPAPQRRRGAIQ